MLQENENQLLLGLCNILQLHHIQIITPQLANNNSHYVWHQFSHYFPSTLCWVSIRDLSTCNHFDLPLSWPQTATDCRCLVAVLYHQMSSSESYDISGCWVLPGFLGTLTHTQVLICPIPSMYLYLSWHTAFVSSDCHRLPVFTTSSISSNMKSLELQHIRLLGVAGISRYCD